MNAKLLLAAVLVVATSFVNAAKMYKIVDKDGNVTFSQTPPNTQQIPDDVKVEEMKITSGAMSSVTTEMGYEYCGDIRLPKQSGARNSSKYFAETVLNSKKRWQESLDRLTQQVQQRNDRQMNANLNSHKAKYDYQKKLIDRQGSSFLEQSQRNATKMKDLRCAINWVGGKEEKVKQYQSEDRAESQRLDTIIAELEQKLNRKCGSQPEFNPSNPYNKQDRSVWYKCSRDIRRDIDSTERQKRRLIN